MDDTPHKSAPHMTESYGEYQTLHEFVEAAHRKLPGNIWHYLVGGTETETTVARNRHALDSVALRPRVLRDMTHVDTTGSFLGRRIRLPVMLAPVGGLEAMHPEGAAEAHRGAAEFGVPIMVSSATKPGLETTAQAADGYRIFQLYVRGDDAFMDDHVRRAQDNGYTAFAITVDSAVYSRRERDIAGRFAKPWRRDARGPEFQASFTWDKVKRFKDKFDIPLILKGIGTAEDAALCCEHGVEVVYVSNHGGRQLDHGLGSLDVLPEVVREVRGRARVMMDGAISRGTDLVKAIALGADCVGIGRLYCYGLAAEGAAGVVRLLELLETETAVALALMGVNGFDQLGPSYLTRAHSVAAPHVHSAFPLLSGPHHAPFSPVAPVKPE
jgi:glycolate oxidase